MQSVLDNYQAMNKKNTIISKLNLTEVELTDADFLYELYNLSDRREKRPLITKEGNKKFVSDYVHNTKNKIFDAWYVIKFDDKSIGSVTLRKDSNECGYWLLPKYQNQGIGSWAFNELMRLNPRPFYALVIHPYNKRSINLAKKFGFKLDTYKFVKKSD